MALKDTVFKQTVKKKGYWNFRDFYDFCFDWLSDNGYTVVEKEYKEKASGDKEIEIEWAASKKVTDYYKYTISLKWHILGMTDAEIERDGKRESTNKGEVKIVFKADFIKDYEERWEDKPFWKFMRGVYDKYVVRTTNDEYEDRLVDDVLELINQVKSFLEIQGR